MRPLVDSSHASIVHSVRRFFTTRSGTPLPPLPSPPLRLSAQLFMDFMDVYILGGRGNLNPKGGGGGVCVFVGFSFLSS